MNTINKLLVSKKEAAQALSISIRSLEYLIARRELQTRRIGKRVLVLASALHKFVKRDHANALVPTGVPSEGEQ